MRSNPRAAAPNVGRGLRIISSNVLNYFNGNGTGGGFPTSRGANTLAEFNRQRAHILAMLTQAKGIGPWTAEIYLMFAHGRPDIMPGLDLGLVVAAQHLKKLRKRPDAKRLLKIAEAWRPSGYFAISFRAQARLASVKAKLSGCFSARRRTLIGRPRRTRYPETPEWP